MDPMTNGEQLYAKYKRAWLNQKDGGAKGKHSVGEFKNLYWLEMGYFILSVVQQVKMQPEECFSKLVDSIANRYKNRKKKISDGAPSTGGTSASLSTVKPKGSSRNWASLQVEVMKDLEERGEAGQAKLDEMRSILDKKVLSKRVLAARRKEAKSFARYEAKLQGRYIQKYDDNGDMITSSDEDSSDESDDEYDG